MNVVVSGPFGQGSLADEALLAGLLVHLIAAKHKVTVLTPEPQAVLEIYDDVEALKLPAPGTMLSTPKIWDTLSKSQLLVIISAGVISDKGEVPARVWLGQAEHGRRAGAKTAVMSLGAVPIEDTRERVRVQRQLHNFTDYISVRDAESKRVVIDYAISATRVSHNGDFTLALLRNKIEAKPDAKVARTAGVVLSNTIPTRGEFGLGSREFSPEVIQQYRAVVEKLTKAGIRVRLFHDDIDEARAAAETICEDLPDDLIDHPDAGDDIATTRERMAGCGVVFSPSLHGLILATTCSVPVVGMAAETGASSFLTSLGLAENALRGAAINADDVVAAIQRVLGDHAKLQALVIERVAGLAKKQAQDARTLELLVPRRDRRPVKSDEDEDDEDGGGEDTPRGDRPREKDNRGAGRSGGFGRGGRGPKASPKGKGRSTRAADPWFSE
jgi:polysaccharide pyruvyl transferase WcaK-like protein